MSYGVLIAPEWIKVRPGGELNISTQQQLLNDRKTYLANLTTMVSLYKDYNSQDTKQINSLLPTGQNVPELFALYEKIASNHGMTLQSIDVSADAPGGQVKKVSGVSQLSVNLKLSNASYRAFKAFLAEAEQSQRLIDIGTMNYDSRTKFLTMRVVNYFGQ